MIDDKFWEWRKLYHHTPDKVSCLFAEKERH